MIFDRIYKSKKRKIKEEPYNSPYKNMSYVILNNNIDHQGIGGKKGYIDRYLSIDELLYKIGERCIGALNFVERRPDLFKHKNLKNDLYKDFLSYVCACMVSDRNIDKETLKRYLYPKAYKKGVEYYYIKIWQTDGYNGTYLGYFVCSDECKKIVKEEH